MPYNCYLIRVRCSHHWLPRFASLGFKCSLWHLGDRQIKCSGNCPEGTTQGQVIRGEYVLLSPALTWKMSSTSWFKMPFSKSFLSLNSKIASLLKHSVSTVQVEWLHNCTWLGHTSVWKSVTSGALPCLCSTLACSEMGVSSSEWPSWPWGEPGCSMCAGKSWAPARHPSPRWTTPPPLPTAWWSGWVLCPPSSPVLHPSSASHSQYTHKIPNKWNPSVFVCRHEDIPGWNQALIREMSRWKPPVFPL